MSHFTRLTVQTAKELIFRFEIAGVNEVVISRGMDKEVIKEALQVYLNVIETLPTGITGIKQNEQISGR